MVTTPAQWWHRRDDQIVCTLCPRECALHKGQRGFCFVRQNVDQEMVLTTYGRSSGFCIDPIEKKPLNHFLPGTPVLSFGTAGCNLGCKFCQNWSTSKAREFDEQTDYASPDQIAEAAIRHGCRSVAFTYNDPVIWAEYAIDTARACHDRGVGTVAVTAGYISPAARKDFYAVIDAANVDLKGFTQDFYKYVTLSQLEPVLDTLRWLKHESDVWFEITNLMIPGENDSVDESRRMCDWIVENLGPDVPMHFTAFHPDFRMRDHQSTPPSTLQRARRIAEQAGIRFAYVGNVHDVEGQSTYCPGCGALLIERDWYVLGKYDLNRDRCRQCHTQIPGVFEERPGTWGAKRQPIRIAPPEVIPLSLPSPAMSTTKPSAAPSSKKVTSPMPPPRSSGPPSWLMSVIEVSSADQSKPAAVPKAAEAVQREGASTAEAGTVSQHPTRSPASSVSSLRVEFDETDSQSIAEHARAVAEAVVQHLALPQLKASLAQIPAYGIFVTFRLGQQLRSCKGQFGHVSPLGTMLNAVVQDSATNDPRFPPIQAHELPGLTVEVSLMYDPQQIRNTGEARVNEVHVGEHGLVLAHPGGRGLLLPQVAIEQKWDSLKFLQGVSRKAGLPADAWCSDQAQLMTFRARIFHSDAKAQCGGEIRLPARAGQFYPADPDEMRAHVAKYLEQARTDTQKVCRAVVLPHAGWIFCGSVTGQTLARITVPRTVIVVGPKHTAAGPNWSISDADRWQIPGATVPVHRELRARLLELLPQFACESAAHRQEHAIEVLVPFLHVCNPDVQIVPVEVGPTSFSQTQAIAQALAIVCRESPEPVLLVISTDLNHFAAEAENRRKDLLAIQAMETGRADTLFEVTQKHQISMCGVIPAVIVLRALELTGSIPQPELVCYDNSSSTSGQFDRVVGYAGMTIE